MLAHIHGMSVGDKYYGEKYNEEDRICQGDVRGGGVAVGMRVGRGGKFSLFFWLMHILYIFLIVSNINEMPIKGCKELIKCWST